MCRPQAVYAASIACGTGIWSPTMRIQKNDLTTLPVNLSHRFGPNNIQDIIFDRYFALYSSKMFELYCLDYNN